MDEAKQLEQARQMGWPGEAAGTDPATWTNQTLLLDWDSSSVVLVDTDRVSVWGDDSGASNDFSQGTAPNRPRQIGGRILSATGQFEYVEGPILSTFTGGGALSAVFALDVQGCDTDDANLGNNDCWLADSAGFCVGYCRSTGKVGFGFFETSYKSVEIEVDTLIANHMVGLRWDGATLHMSVDDKAWSSVSVGSPDAENNVTRLLSRASAATGLDGGIYECVISNDFKTEAEVTAVMAFYNDKYPAY